VAPSGRRVSLWVGEGFDHVMAFTGDTVEPRSRRRHGIAIEPMTCPPNTFASGGRDTARGRLHLACDLEDRGVTLLRPVPPSV
jgi:galactose mutarotase-like enzyme